MINFPDTPTLAQIFTTAGSSWQWDGNKWEGATVAGGGPYLLLTGGTLTGALRVNPNIVIGNPVTSPPATSLVINNAASTPQAATGALGQPLFWVASEGATQVPFGLFDHYGSTGTPQIWGRRSRGTAAAPAAVQVSDNLLVINGAGYGTTTSGVSTQIIFQAVETWNDTAHGSQIVFGVAAPGLTSPLGRMQIRQGVVIGNPAPDPGQGGLTLNANAAAPPLLTGWAPQLQLAAADVATAQLILDTASAASAFSPSWLVMRRSRGTAAAPTAVQSGDIIGSILASGYAATAMFSAARIDLFATQNWTDTAHGGAVAFNTVANGTGTAVERMRIDHNGNVGIGTATPQNTLDVNGAITVRMQGTPAISIDHITGSYRFIRWLTSGSARWDVVINATAEGSGNVGSDFNITRYDNTGTALGVALSINRSNGACFNITGTWTAISDASVKQDVEPYTRGLDAIVALKPVQFRYVAGTPFTEGDKPSRQLFGLIADEVKPHVPEIVGTTKATVGKKEGVELSTLEPGNLIYALINAVKELNAKIAAMSPPPARRKAA